MLASRPGLLCSGSQAAQQRGVGGGGLAGQDEELSRKWQPCALGLPPGCVHPMTLLPAGVPGAHHLPGEGRHTGEPLRPGWQQRFLMPEQSP